MLKAHGVVTEAVYGKFMKQIRHKNPYCEVKTWVFKDLTFLVFIQMAKYRVQLPALTPLPPMKNNYTYELYTIVVSLH